MTWVCVCGGGKHKQVPNTLTWPHQATLVQLIPVSPTSLVDGIALETTTMATLVPCHVRRGTPSPGTWSAQLAHGALKPVMVWWHGLAPQLCVLSFVIHRTAYVWSHHPTCMPHHLYFRVRPFLIVCLTIVACVGSATRKYSCQQMNFPTHPDPLPHHTPPPPASVVGPVILAYLQCCCSRNPP